MNLFLFEFDLMLMLVFLIGFDLALKDCVVTVFSGDEFDDELDEDSSCSSSFSGF